ncbi:MAG: hypothetical protein ISR96_05365 [Nitrospira sp.]|nr:hypothetical protein [bacterium]MBL7048928.1 hypothetical protein [Nitrospira sp.]
MNDIEKLKHLLSHWKEHNDAHITTYSEWESKARKLNQEDVAEILKEISTESKKMNGLFDRAMKLL